MVFERHPPRTSAAIGDTTRMSYPLSASGWDVLLKRIETRNQALKQQAGEKHVKRPQSYAADRFNDQPPPTPQAHNDPDSCYFIIVDNPSPPCIRSIDELEPVALSELEMNSHHRGKFLLVRLVRNMGCGRTSAFACIADGNWDVECLKLSFVCMNLDVGHRWPQQGHCFAIKEPHLTIDDVNMEICIRVDHPSDLLDVACLPQSQLTRTVFSNIRADLHNTTPLQCKEAGNLALKNGDLHGSLTCYTRGLQRFMEDPNLKSLTLSDVRRDLLRNRAYIRLKLGQYEGTVVDAIASLSDHSTDKLRKLDAKAYSRAGQASYALKNYDAAAEHCRNLLSLQEDHEDASQLHARTKARLQEQVSGNFDIPAIRRSVSRTNPRVDAADFLSNTTVKASGPGRGRGLFATKNLEADHNW